MKVWITRPALDDLDRIQVHFHDVFRSK